MECETILQSGNQNKIEFYDLRLCPEEGASQIRRIGSLGKCPRQFVARRTATARFSFFKIHISNIDLKHQKIRFKIDFKVNTLFLTACRDSDCLTNT
jgi:hypothetical protein